MNETLGVMLAMAMGYAIAGVVGSAHILVTSQRLKFEALSRSRQTSRPHGWSASSSAALAMLLVCGPVVLMGNAIRAARAGLRPRYWLFLSTLVASGWSFCVGLVMLNMLVVLNLV